MDIIFQLLKNASPYLSVAVLAIGALIYVYKDAKAERKERQIVMDKQNEQWLELYKANLEETANVRQEMSKTREVISELKVVIHSLKELVLKQIV